MENKMLNRSIKKTFQILVLISMFGCSYIFSTESDGSTKPNAVFINKSPINIEYDINKSGFDMVNRVVLFISDDKGMTWTKYGEDQDLTSPFEFLPTKEGEFYFSIVVYDKAGNNSGLPVSGVSGLSAPLYVDFTPPKVTLEQPRGGEFLSSAEPLIIKYRVMDKHLPLKPVSIYASSKGGKIGSWKLIASDLPFEYEYKYKLPNTNIENLAIKVTARDMVGLVGSDISDKPIHVRTDKPSVSITGIVVPKNSGYSVSDCPQPSTSKVVNSSVKTNIAQETIQKNKRCAINREKETHSKAAFIAFTMAGNLVRQGRTKDALRYYMTALSSDPKFIDAMSDSALIYKALGDYKQAKKMLLRAINIAPERPKLYHNLAEVYQSEGFDLLKIGKYTEGMMQVSKAVKEYGNAIDFAEKSGKLSGRAASFFRLGEISFFANSDIEGAKSYWLKVINLHTPSPDPLDTEQDYQHYTQLKIELNTWQNWALQYLKQLKNREDRLSPQPQPTGYQNTQGIYMTSRQSLNGKEPTVAVNPDYTPLYLNPKSNCKIQQRPVGSQKEDEEMRSTRFWNWRRR